MSAACITSRLIDLTTSDCGRTSLSSTMTTSRRSSSPASGASPMGAGSSGASSFGVRRRAAWRSSTARDGRSRERLSNSWRHSRLLTRSRAPRLWSARSEWALPLSAMPGRMERCSLPSALSNFACSTRCAIRRWNSTEGFRLTATAQTTWRSILEPKISRCSRSRVRASDCCSRINAGTCWRTLWSRSRWSRLPRSGSTPARMDPSRSAPGRSARRDDWASRTRGTATCAHSLHAWRAPSCKLQSRAPSASWCCRSVNSAGSNSVRSN